MSPVKTFNSIKSSRRIDEKVADTYNDLLSVQISEYNWLLNPEERYKKLEMDLDMCMGFSANISNFNEDTIKIL